MVTVAIIIAAWIVVSVPLSLGLGFLVRHSHADRRPQVTAAREPRRLASARQLLH